MAKLPYYPFYVDDFDNDDKVRDMELAEVGLYILSLNEGWRAGSIPDDVEQLAVDIRRKVSKIRDAWPKVRSCFAPNESGRLVNAKQEKVRSEVEKRSESARLSAEARWLKYRKSKETGVVLPTSSLETGVVLPTPGASDANADANALKNGCELHTRAFGLVCVSPPVPSASSEKQKFWKAEALDRFIKLYPLAVNDWDCQIFIGAIQNEQAAADLFTNLEIHKQTEQWQRGMIPSAENFLRKGIWKVRPKSPPVKPASARSKLAASLEGIMTGRQA